LLPKRDLPWRPIHREKVVISRYDGRLVTEGRLIEKDRAKVEGSLKRLMKLWRLPIGTVHLEDEHTILVAVKGPLTPEQYAAVHKMLDEESKHYEGARVADVAISS
jgi:hypothetical protein